MTISVSDEAEIHNRIAALKTLLPPREPKEPTAPMHTVVTKVFLDRGTHTRTVDLANDWGRVGSSIRDAVKQGAEVTLRPLYPGESGAEVKHYPSAERIKVLEEAIREVVEDLRLCFPGTDTAVEQALCILRGVLDAGKGAKA